MDRAGRVIDQPRVCSESLRAYAKTVASGAQSSWTTPSKDSGGSQSGEFCDVRPVNLEDGPQ